jgi:hypothetical protein
MIVEVYDHRGVLRSRHRIDRYPAVIGRALSADIILDDPHVAAEHVRLSRDDQGAIHVEDLGSRNGTVDADTGRSIQSAEWRAGLGLRVGRTQLRLRGFDDPVPPEVPLGAPVWSVVPGSRGLLLLITAASVALLVLGSWTGGFQGTSAPRQLGETLAILTGLVTWAGCWGLGGRLARQEVRFLAHLALASVGTLATALLITLSAWITAIVPGTAAADVFLVMVVLPLLYAWLSKHLALASAMGPRRRARVSGAVVGGFTLLAGLGAWAGDGDYSAAVEYDAALKPLPPALVASVSVDDFVRLAADLRDEADSLAARADRRTGSPRSGGR